MICIQVVLVILVVLFSEKNHLHIYALKTKKIDVEPEKFSTMAPKTRVTGKNNKE